MEPPGADTLQTSGPRPRSRRPRPTDIASSTRDELLAQADRAEASRDPISAIEALTAANQLERDADVEVRLVALRHHAFGHLATEAGRRSWPPELDDPFPEVFGEPPEIAASQLDAAVLGGSIVHHGCLLVRGLITEARAAQLADDIDRAHEVRRQRIESGQLVADQSWFVPFQDFDPPFGMDPFSEGLRSSDQPSLMTADSPRTLFDVLDTFEEIGLVPIIEEYLGERAVLSIEKTTVRRTSQAWPSWHQDGSFITGGVRTVDCWLALGHCGGDSDTLGLDIVPRRFAQVITFNDGQGNVPFVIPPERVAELTRDTPVVSPEFWAGDALLFDDLFLHCTGWPREQHTGTRRAVESWFFGASRYPTQYSPIVC